MTFTKTFVHKLTLLLVWITFYRRNGSSARTAIKTAWLCTEQSVYIGFNASNNLGALSFSLETISNDTSLLSGYSFDVRYSDSDCNSKSSLGALVDLIETGFHPDLVVGPLCSPAMLSSGLLGAELNIPTFGWISSDPSVQDKTQYSTLVRLLWPVSSIGEGTLLLMQEFGWRKAFLISTEGNDYGELARSVRDVISGSGLSVTNWERDVEEKASQATISAIYRQVKQEARIVILSVPLSEVRDWMLAVYTEEMHRGEYVFIYINQQTVDESLYTQITGSGLWQAEDGQDDNVRQAIENLFMVLAKMNDFEQVDQFLSDFNSSAWTTPLAGQLGITPTDANFYSMFLYDTMRLYAWAATQVLAEGGDLADGAALFDKSRSSVTTGGATGDIIMDDNADRIPDYWLFDVSEDGTFVVAAATVTTKQGSDINRAWSFEREPRWGDGTVGAENAPLDEPLCGFDNENCPPTTLYISVGVTLGVLLLVCVVAFFVYRKIQYERTLNNMAWKVNYEDVNIYTGMRTGFGSMADMQAGSRVTTHSQDSRESTGGQVFITVANYRGNMVAVKTVNKKKVDINRLFLQEMKQMLDVKQVNLNTFLGACIDAPHICALWEYCSKGSLQDVIANDAINLDTMLKFAISIDLLKGLQFLHESHFEYHGNLKSSNVVIDGRWLCKLTDFGLHQLLKGAERGEESDHSKYSSLYWTAPEILKTQYSEEQSGTGTERYSVGTKRYSIGTPQADMYAVGVILKEIFCRNEPYEEFEELDPKDIITNILVQNGEFRPSLSELHQADLSERGRRSLEGVIGGCWSEEARDRDTVQSVLKKVTRLNPSKQGTVLDNMLVVMEKYSAQLELKVAEETESLVTEKHKTEQLLLKMLPRSVADDLKQGKAVDAEAFDCVTIYFSDIPGFSDFAAASTPVQVVDLLNSVYSAMDDVIAQYDVYKVETVGDVYVLVSGLPERNGERHIVEISDCALHLLSVISGLRIQCQTQYTAKLRIGIHTGPIVAGVIGLSMPRYCLFGDTINTSSRMESTGSAMRIHLSTFAFQALSKFSGYKLSDRGKIPVKGKGEMNTYWLTGKEDFHRPLPDFDAMFKLDAKPPSPLPVTRGKAQPKRPLRPSVESGFSERTGTGSGGQSHSALLVANGGTSIGNVKEVKQNTTVIAVAPATEGEDVNDGDRDLVGNLDETESTESGGGDDGGDSKDGTKRRRNGTVDRAQATLDV